MNPELNDSSFQTPLGEGPPSPEVVATEPTSTLLADEHASRAEMESSVLDALRPLLKGKRDRKDATADEGSAVVPESTMAADDERDGHSVDTLPLPETSGEIVTARAEADDELESFATIGEELERRSRQSATMVRLLEQHRQQLESAEKQRDDAYDKLARVVPLVQETGHALREAMEARKVDDDPARMHRLFMLNGRALDELEKVAVDLFADFLWCKSAWEQYARSVEDARKLRSQLDV